MKTVQDHQESKNHCDNYNYFEMLEIFRVFKSTVFTCIMNGLSKGHHFQTLPLDSSLYNPLGQ